MNDRARYGWCAPIAASVLLLCGGCAGYRLGTSLPPGVRSVHVPTFVNRCGEPQVENETTQATVREFQKDGTLRVVAEEQADAVLNVTLVKYEMEPLRYERDRPKTAAEYRLKITADVALIGAPGKKVLMQTRAEGEWYFDAGEILASAKRDALPRVARELARRIVDSVVQHWY